MHRRTIVCGYRSPTGLDPQLECSPKAMEQEETRLGRVPYQPLSELPRKTPKVPQPLFCILCFHSHTLSEKTLQLSQVWRYMSMTLALGGAGIEGFLQVCVWSITVEVGF